jgi:hypothetical protein
MMVGDGGADPVIALARTLIIIHGKINFDPPILLGVNEVHSDSRITSRFICRKLVCLGVKLCVSVLIKIRSNPTLRQAVAQSIHDIFYRFVGF